MILGKRKLSGVTCFISLKLLQMSNQSVSQNMAISYELFK